jgi:hypothetical protein
VQAQQLNLDEKCKKLEETIQRQTPLATPENKQIKSGLTRSVPESKPSKTTSEEPKMLTN